MRPLAEALLVFAIVGAAASYAALKFMPAAWRRAVAASVASFAARSGMTAVQARRVEAKLASGGACGSCDSCKACATPARDDAATPAEGYRRIPIRRASS